eukprot:6189438-Pleurochrysis_carterae.AAC.1
MNDTAAVATMDKLKDEIVLLNELLRAGRGVSGRRKDAGAGRHTRGEGAGRLVQEHSIRHLHLLTSMHVHMLRNTKSLTQARTASFYTVLVARSLRLQESAVSEAATCASLPSHAAATYDEHAFLILRSSSCCLHLDRHFAASVDLSTRSSLALLLILSMGDASPANQLFSRCAQWTWQSVRLPHGLYTWQEMKLGQVSPPCKMWQR